MAERKANELAALWAVLWECERVGQRAAGWVQHWAENLAVSSAESMVFLTAARWVDHWENEWEHLRVEQWVAAKADWRAA